MKSTEFLYGTTVGRWLLSQIMKHHWDRIAVNFLCSPLSKPMVSRYVRKHHVLLTAAQKGSFRTFRDFFARTREDGFLDVTPEHLISPCDGWLSVFPIDEASLFHIKNSHYRVGDLVREEALARNYSGGTCLIFRLCPQDYHHYCYIDDGFQGTYHHIPGVLHSVQPIAYETYPVYTLNRRCWSLLTTEHFGPVVWTEVGALIVGGIHNEHENQRVTKGMEKGHFDLAGSTIVLLFEKGKVELLPELLTALSEKPEVRVRQGQKLGVPAAPRHSGNLLR